MPQVSANGLQLEYDSFGDRDAPVVLLIMGLGTQMIAWRDGFCAALAAEGLHVVRFDNRDIGLSSKFDTVRTPGLLTARLKRFFGLNINAPYDLRDMARDTAALIDALNLSRVHAVGASMGGMIAQELAAHHPGLVQSLVSIMSGHGHPSHMRPRGDVLRHMFLSRPGGTDREAVEAHALRTLRLIGSPGFADQDDDLLAYIRQSLDRSYYPAGYMRHLMAVLASGNRLDSLRRIAAPTLVIHGLADPLVPVRGGRDTAANIAGAQLELIEGMGHDLPKLLWPRLVGLIAGHVKRHDAGSGDLPAASEVLHVG